MKRLYRRASRRINCGEGAVDVIKSGTKITCPLCGVVVGEVVKDIGSGDVLSKDNIKVYGDAWSEGDEMTCVKCGFPVCVEMVCGAVLHTEDGWQPLGLPSSALFPFIYDYLKKHGRWRREWDELLRAKRKNKGLGCRA